MDLLNFVKVAKVLLNRIVYLKEMKCYHIKVAARSHLAKAIYHEKILKHMRFAKAVNIGVEVGRFCNLLRL